MAIVPVFLVLLLVLGAAAAVGAAVTRRSPPSRETTVAAARQHASRSAAAALVLAAAAAVGAALAGALVPHSPVRTGLVALAVPLAAGIAHTGVLLVGELCWPRPEGAVRRAGLAHRGLLDAAPRRLVRAAAGTAGAAVVLLVAGGLVAEPDGRSVAVRAGDGRASGAASPFAGTAYGWPALVGLALLAALVLAALRVVATRPAVVTADPRIEEALRRASAHRVLRGAVASALVVTGGLLAVSGLAVRSAATGAAQTALGNGLPTGAPAAVLPWVGGALAVLGLLAVVGGLVVLCVRGPGVPVAAGDPVAA